MVLNIIGILLIITFIVFNILLFTLYMNVRHVVNMLNTMINVKMKFDDFKSLFNMLKERWS